MAETPPPETPAPGAEAPKKEAPPAKLEGKDASSHPWVASIAAAVPGSVVSAREYAKQVSVVVAREKVVEVARHLKDREDFKYCV
ncbi:MAG TPA: hypothetical protein VGQ32_02265, partial [Thermoanaerobaculia bacterium]|nr:hypothetical protein [Thermoanaerobaculia bacterium]